MSAKAARLLLLGIIFCATGAHATQLILQKWVAVSRSLDGTVTVLGTDEPASGATVELCSPGWKKVIASPRADHKGHFSLGQDAESKLFYLRVSASNMDIYQLRVRIDKHAGQELRIRLSVAT